MTDQPRGGVELPRNIEAEASALGSMIVDNAACFEIVKLLEPEDFYLEKHQIIYKAIVGLITEKNACDVIMLTNCLKESGQLDKGGGASYLGEIIESVPAGDNGEFYARIVGEQAILRRVLKASHEAIQQVENRSESAVSIAQGYADEMLAAATSKSKTGPRAMKEIMQELIDDLEARQGTGTTKRPITLTGISQLIPGFGGGELVIIAARPSMGKSALARRIAHDLTAYGPVVFFSMEESEKEVVGKIIAAKAEKPYNLIDSGRLGDDDWDWIIQQSNSLFDCNLFVDDDPEITMHDITLRCRELQGRHPLTAIMIDYLQLMSIPRSIARGSSREQQIAWCSRRAKILAREMGCPVFLLSQLNRQCEQRPDGRPRLSDLRDCVTGDTRVLLSDGSRPKICDLAGAMPILVTVENRKITQAYSEKIWHAGKKKVFLLKTKSGLEIKATAAHRFPGYDKWIQLRDLKPGDRIAIARKIPEPVNPIAWPKSRIILVAQMIGDGSYISGKPLRYTSSCVHNLEAVKTAAKEEFDSKITEWPVTGAISLVISGNGNRWHPKGMGRWIKSLGIWNQRSHEKIIPNEIFQHSNDDVGLFLRHLWATDGTFSVPRGRSAPAIAYSSTSKDLIHGVNLLLKRFGIVGRIKKTESKNTKHNSVYHLSVTGKEFQELFIESIGAFGRKIIQMQLFKKAICKRKPTTNVDTIPNEVFVKVRQEMRRQGISQRKMAAMRGVSCNGSSAFKFNPSRMLLRKYAELLGSDTLIAESETDYFWDAVKSIAPAGMEDVYDLTVPQTECWAADGIITHNSGAIEQDADRVLLLHRPDEHDKKCGRASDGARRGVMEVQVGKNRSGPTGGVLQKLILPTMQVVDLNAMEEAAYRDSFERKNGHGKKRQSGKDRAGGD